MPLCSQGARHRVLLPMSILQVEISRRASSQGYPLAIMALDENL